MSVRTSGPYNTETFLAPFFRGAWDRAQMPPDDSSVGTEREPTCGGCSSHYHFGTGSTSRETCLPPLSLTQCSGSLVAQGANPKFTSTNPFPAAGVCIPWGQYQLIQAHCTIHSGVLVAVLVVTSVFHLCKVPFTLKSVLINHRR